MARIALVRRAASEVLDVTEPDVLISHSDPTLRTLRAPSVMPKLATPFAEVLPMLVTAALSSATITAVAVMFFGLASVHATAAGGSAGLLSSWLWIALYRWLR